MIQLHDLTIRLPSPTATTVASKTFPCAFSGIIRPDFVFTSGANRSTSTRSNIGRNFLNARA